MEKEVEIFIDTDEIGSFLFEHLIKRGLVPSEEDIDVISEVLFDFLIKKGVAEEK